MRRKIWKGCSGRHRELVRFTGHNSAAQFAQAVGFSSTKKWCDRRVGWADFGVLNLSSEKFTSSTTGLSRFAPDKVQCPKKDVGSGRMKRIGLSPMLPSNTQGYLTEIGSHCSCWYHTWVAQSNLFQGSRSVLVLGKLVSWGNLRYGLLRLVLGGVGCNNC